MSLISTPAYNALLDTLQQRYSCRAYQPTPVPHDVIEKLLIAAQRTASSCNSQPWQVHLLSGAARDNLSDKLYQAASAHTSLTGDLAPPTQFVDVYRDRRYTCGMQLYDSLNIPRHDKLARAQQMLDNYRFFGAPHVALIFNAADMGPYGILDCGAYATNFMNAATAMGLGSVPQAAIAYYPEVVKTFLGLEHPGSLQLVCAISFGYPNHEHPINHFRTERASLADVVVWHE